MTLLAPPKRFPIGGDSQGMVMNPIWGIGERGFSMGGAVSRLGVLSWKERRAFQQCSFLRDQGLDSGQWTYRPP